MTNFIEESKKRFEAELDNIDVSTSFENIKFYQLTAYNRAVDFFYSQELTLFVDEACKELGVHLESIKLQRDVFYGELNQHELINKISSEAQKLLKDKIATK